MSNLVDLNPYGVYNDLQGRPLNNGKVYIGLPNQDPKGYPAQVYWDAAMTIPAAQPLRTVGGYVARNGTPARVYVNGNYSLQVTTSTDVQVFYVQDYFLVGSSQVVTPPQLTPVFDSIAALRANANPNIISKACSVTSYYGGNAVALQQPPFQGNYFIKTSDTTSADNGSTIIVDAAGNRWYLSKTPSLSSTQFGADPTGIADCATAFSRIANYLSTFSSTATPPKIVFPAGTYSYSASPNWAIKNAVYEFELGTVLSFTGSGIAVNFDGGSSGAGVYGVKFLGFPTIKGNASASVGLFTQAIQHSKFEAVIRDVTTYCLWTKFCVSNEYGIKVSPLGAPAFSPIPATGLYLDKRGNGELTSNCTFYTPIIEGVSGYGIALQSAIQNTFIGGTSESNGGGITISANSLNNTFINTDLEFNATIDINCVGQYNNFIGVLSSTTSTFAGLSNVITSGLFNTIVSSGTDNEFIKVRYASNAGGFTDSGVGTIKRAVRNVTSNTLDPELISNPFKLLFIDGAVGGNTIIASDDQLIGGSNADASFYHYGSGKVRFWAGGANVLEIAPSKLGFYGNNSIAKPTVTGAKGGNAALASLLSQLAALGLITDSST